MAFNDDDDDDVKEEEEEEFFFATTADRDEAVVVVIIVIVDEAWAVDYVYDFHTLKVRCVNTKTCGTLWKPGPTGEQHLTLDGASSAAPQAHVLSAAAQSKLDAAHHAAHTSAT